jgi:predicted SAM-dependent methyltransferase
MLVKINQTFYSRGYIEHMKFELLNSFINDIFKILAPSYAILCSIFRINLLLILCYTGLE